MESNIHRVMGRILVFACPFYSCILDWRLIQSLQISVYEIHSVLFIIQAQRLFKFLNKQNQQIPRLHKIQQQLRMKFMKLSNKLKSCFTIHNNISRFSFSTHPYFLNKAALQKQKIANSFIHDSSKLIQLNVNMKQLSPNFFTKCIPMYETKKVLMQNKETNILDNSYIAVDVHVNSDPQIQLNMRKFSSNQVRIGRLMELMDSIAGLVGYRHCFGSLSEINPFILVTGSVDSINFFQPITIDQDIKMEGYVTSVGKTSMEIQINIFQQNRLKCNTLFTMISRNAQDSTKSYPCPALDLTHLSQEEQKKAKKRNQDGQRNKKRRMVQMMSSYLNSPPTQKDIKILHQLFLSKKKHQMFVKSNSIVIEQTKICNTLIMHLQQRNVHNKIFGGYLMREMLDTAWMTANKFTEGKKFHVEDITNIYFRNPVQIGDELRITAKVSYTQGTMMVVSVQAYSFNYNLRRDLLCSDCLVFMKTEEEQPSVYPVTYENGIHYLSSKRAYEQIFT